MKRSANYHFDLWLHAIQVPIRARRDTLLQFFYVTVLPGTAIRTCRFAQLFYTCSSEHTTLCVCKITCTTKHWFPWLLPHLQTDWHKTAGQTGQFGQTDKSCVTVITTVAANYLLIAPDDEAPRLPVFLKGEVKGWLQVNACYSCCLQYYIYVVLWSMNTIFPIESGRKKSKPNVWIGPTMF